MTTMKAANLALKFALELVAVAVFAYWGATAGTGVGAVALAVATPVAVALLWARYAAPRSARRLPLRRRTPFELAVFALAALALLRSSTAAGAAFALVAVLNAGLLGALGQSEA